jgi:hypothetical protein
VEALRARYRTAEEIRADGAMGNLGDGVEITTHGIATRLIAWPGTGLQTEAVHVLTIALGEESDRYRYDLAAPASGTSDALHTHPVSDECLVMWHGDSAEFFIGGTWLPAQANDVALAPCGVAHGHRSQGVTLFGGYASPPQLDLLMPTDYYADGAFTVPTPTQLSVGGQSPDSAHG